MAIVSKDYLYYVKTAYNMLGSSATSVDSATFKTSAWKGSTDTESQSIFDAINVRSSSGLDVVELAAAFKVADADGNKDVSTTEWNNFKTQALGATTVDSLKSSISGAISGTFGDLKTYLDDKSPSNAALKKIASSGSAGMDMMSMLPMMMMGGSGSNSMMPMMMMMMSQDGGGDMSSMLPMMMMMQPQGAGGSSNSMLPMMMMMMSQDGGDSDMSSMLPMMMMMQQPGGSSNSMLPMMMMMMNQDGGSDSMMPMMMMMMMQQPAAAARPASSGLGSLASLLG